jgi:hypothetical protein
MRRYGKKNARFLMLGALHKVRKQRLLAGNNTYL